MGRNTPQPHLHSSDADGDRASCGWEQIPRYLIRDRDGAYGEIFIRRVRSIGIRDRPTSPRSPSQNAYAERLMGSIRRECLDHIVVFGERHLRRADITCRRGSGIMGCETTRLDRWEEMLEAARTDGHIHAHRLFAIGTPGAFNSFRQVSSICQYVPARNSGYGGRQDRIADLKVRYVVLRNITQRANDADPLTSSRRSNTRNSNHRDGRASTRRESHGRAVLIIVTTALRRHPSNGGTR
jgi:hypothetical protein